MTVTEILIMLLMVDAAVVLIGLTKKKNMWHFIVLYWFILTVKNLLDFAKIL